MAFGIGIHTEGADAGELRGEKTEIAVDCWFTSSGSTIPRMFKYQDAQGMIHTVSGIRVLYQEEKRYCGVQTVEYRCEIEENGVKRDVKLIFLTEEHRWMICWA